MKYKVLNKQQNSKKCIVYGMDNRMGLKASFYELENGELVALFKPLEEHQSYPGRLHGGVASAILDETIGRAIMITNKDTFGVTIELSLKYKKPVPLDEELRVIGRITKDSSRIFEGSGEILLSNGEVAVTAVGRYMKMPIDKITEAEFDSDMWDTVITGHEPEEIEI